MIRPNVSQLSLQNLKKMILFWPKYQLIRNDTDTIRGHGHAQWTRTRDKAMPRTIDLKLINKIL